MGVGVGVGVRISVGGCWQVLVWVDDFRAACQLGTSFAGVAGAGMP
jgi:hypothetical protein